MFEDASKLLDPIANPIASDSGTREVTRKETKNKKKWLGNVSKATEWRLTKKVVIRVMTTWKI